MTIDWDQVFNIFFQFSIFYIITIYCRMTYITLFFQFAEFEKGKIKNKFLFFISSFLYTYFGLLIINLFFFTTDLFQEKTTNYIITFSIIMFLYAFRKTFIYTYFEDKNFSILNDMINEMKEKLKRKVQDLNNDSNDNFSVADLILGDKISRDNKNFAKILFEAAEIMTYRSWREKDYKGNKIDDAKKADELYFKAIELDPYFEDAYSGYAQNLRLVQKNYEKAIEVFTKLIRINPKYEYAILRRGYCKRSLNDYQGYLEDYNKYLEVRGGFLNFNDYESRALIKNSLNDFYGVIEDLLEANKIRKLDSSNYEMLGKAYLQTGQIADALDAFDKAIKLELNNKDKDIFHGNFPLLCRVYSLQIRTLIDCGKYEMASKQLVQMKSYYPSNPKTLELINLLGSKLASFKDVTFKDDVLIIISDYLDSMKI